MAYHLSRVNPLPAWTNFTDANLLPLLWLIDSGVEISDSMTIPCYDRKALNFLEEANNCFKSDANAKSNKVNYILTTVSKYFNLLLFYFSCLNFTHI